MVLVSDGDGSSSSSAWTDGDTRDPVNTTQNTVSDGCSLKKVQTYESHRNLTLIEE